MMRSFVSFCLQQRSMVLSAAFMLLVWGILSFNHLPFQAFPDAQNVYVEVVIRFPGQAPEEIEKLLTLPVEREMTALPHLINMRSVSIYGLCVVTLTFDDQADDYLSRDDVNARLRDLELPSGADIRISPLSTGVSEIYRYRVHGTGYNMSEIRSTQDWMIERRLRSVPGVADVVTFGSGIREYQVQLEPDKLKDYQLSPLDVYEAVAHNNVNTGGGYIEHGNEALIVRSLGQLHNLQDIGNIAVANRNGVPVYVHNLGRLNQGIQPPTGVAGFNQEDDIVEGVVLMIKGSDTIAVLRAIREKINALNAYGLPPGMVITPIYDRTELLMQSLGTIAGNMTGSFILLAMLLLAFLQKPQIVVLILFTIPLSLLFAFIIMDAAHISTNLISLGGINFGIIIDGAILLVEAVIVRMSMERVRTPLQWRLYLLDTSSQTGRTILLSKMILIAAWLPIFTFQRIEAKIFSSVVWTWGLALAGSLIISLTLVPVILSYLLGSQLTEHHLTIQRIQAAYQRLLTQIFNWPKRFMAVVLLAMTPCMATIPWIGMEFMPTLDEGNIWLTINLPVSISISKARELERDIRRKILDFDEVDSVLSQLGSPEDGLDPKTFSNLEFLIDLKPEAAWEHDSKTALIDHMQQSLNIFPGLSFNFSQAIQDNVEEAISGVKGEIAIKLFGPDLQVLREKAEQIKGIFQSIQGATDIATEQPYGLSQLTIDIDREQIARYGISVRQVGELIEVAVAGKPATTLLEGEQRFNVTIRLDESARNSVSQLANLILPLEGGRSIPLAEIATIRVDQGASRISREDNMRRIAIKCNLKERDTASFVAQANTAIRQQILFPPGYRMAWSSQYESLTRAAERFTLILPASLLLIFLLLILAFRSMKHVLLIMSTIPAAITGGMATLFMTGTHLSVSAGVGLITLAGITAQHGMLLVGQIRQLEREGRGLPAALMEGSLSRLRPILTSALIAMAGLLPAAIADGVGAEIAKPFALVVIGGLAVATVLTLTMSPLLYHFIHSRHTS
ncbi:MAG: hypothetical protein RIQ52_993 [Pseudomonadota bacterium]